MRILAIRQSIRKKHQKVQSLTLKFKSIQLESQHSIRLAFESIPVNVFTDQLADVLTTELDRVASLKTVARPSIGKPMNRFLNHEAFGAKQARRRWERHWKKAGT